MNLNRPFKLSAAAVVMALVTVGPLAHASVVTNGGFEVGDLSGWTVSGDTGYTGAYAFAAHAGDYGAFFGEASGSSIEQVLATTAGATYVVEFWLQLDDGAVPNSFSWSWGGATQALNLNNSPGFDYTRFSTLVTATGAASALRFDFANTQSFWLLDDVSVAIPEPGTLALVGSALLALVAAGGIRQGAGRSAAQPWRQRTV